MKPAVRVLITVLAVIGAAVAAVPAIAADDGSGAVQGRTVDRVRIVVLPADTTFSQLEELGYGSVGYLGVSQHTVDPAQSFLDMSQGSRIRPSAYAEPLDLAGYRGGDPAPEWVAGIVERADKAGLAGRPGTLAASLRRAGWDVAFTPGENPDDPAGLITLDSYEPGKPGAGCSEQAAGCLIVQVAGIDTLAAEPPASDELVIAFARPVEGRRIAPLLVAGPEHPPATTLRSASTRMDGLVISSDIPATALAGAGVEPVAAKPDAAKPEGQPVTAVVGKQPAAVRGLADRLDEIEDRRITVLGTAFAIWLVAGLAVCVMRPGKRRHVAALAATGIALLPGILLLTAAIRPLPGVEFLLVTVAVPLVAWLLAKSCRGRFSLAFAIAAAMTIGLLAADMIAGSKLTPFSLLGPNPAYGARFYGIGNELEAVVGCLVPLAAGAALASHPATRRGGAAAVATFLAVGVVAAVVFAASRWGADVGAAMIIPAGSAVAAAVAIHNRKVLLVAVVAMIIGLAALVASDLAFDGNSHFERTVLDAGSPGRLFEILGRRLGMTAESFATPINLALLISLVGAGGYAWYRRVAIRRWFAGRRALFAGMIGAVGASVVGTIVNDSGALFLIFGAVYVGAALALAWAGADNSGTPERGEEGQ